MKKMGILLLIGALALLSCGKDNGAKDGGNAGTTAGQAAQGKTDLSKETANIKRMLKDKLICF